MSMVFNFALPNQVEVCIPAKGRKTFLIVWQLAIPCPLKSGGGNPLQKPQTPPHLLESEPYSYNLRLTYKRTTRRSYWAPFSSQHQLRLQSQFVQRVQRYYPRFKSSFSLMIAYPNDATSSTKTLIKNKTNKKTNNSAESACLSLYVQYNYSRSAATLAVLCGKTFCRHS